MNDEIAKLTAERDGLKTQVEIRDRQLLQTQKVMLEHRRAREIAELERNRLAARVEELERHLAQRIEMETR